MKCEVNDDGGEISHGNAVEPDYHPEVLQSLTMSLSSVPLEEPNGMKLKIPVKEFEKKNYRKDARASGKQYVTRKNPILHEKMPSECSPSFTIFFCFIIFLFCYSLSIFLFRF